ncbi:uncharacterized protein LOC113850238 isoform X2 [Abrus precatorius]|uniref:Uncharacterized protein LOC113850238 isoform X2 n=1 Tax=Abrus precatorius TaxID=3816 RepID=A0A8B8JYA5_ABRPR|nr:uncharacterized protein LOC113850238 isoform X2 [Abrus precatorius]
MLSSSLVFSYRHFHLSTMASMASSCTFCSLKFPTKRNTTTTSSLPSILFCQKQHHDNPTDQINRRELILRSSELATIGAIFNFRNYNPEGRKNPVTREEAMDELIDVIESTTPDKFTPRIVERKEDYIRVEYQSSILGFVDDVEFWFPPGKGSTVEYRSASRLGNFDFDVNRKRIKALRQELEKRGWASQDTI